MKAPHVKNTIRFKRENVTFHIMAYRKLTKEEMENSVRLYYQQLGARERKKSQQDETITIQTQFGITEGL